VIESQGVSPQRLETTWRLARAWGVMLIVSCLPTSTGKRALVVQNSSQESIAVKVDQGPHGSRELTVTAQGTEVIAQERVTGCHPAPTLPSGYLAVSWSYPDQRTCNLTRSQIEQRAKWDGEVEQWTLILDPSSCTRC